MVQAKNSKQRVSEIKLSSKHNKPKKVTESAIEILDIKRHCGEIDNLREDQCYHLDESQFNIDGTIISICAIISIKGLVDFKATIGYFNSKLMVEEVLEKFKVLPNDSRLILDNAPWHKTVEFKTGLSNYTSKFRGQAIFMPPNCTYESNPIERFFKNIRKLYTTIKAYQQQDTNLFILITQEEKKREFVNFIINNVKNFKPIEEYYKIVKGTRNEMLNK